MEDDDDKEEKGKSNLYDALITLFNCMCTVGMIFVLAQCVCDGCVIPQ